MAKTVSGPWEDFHPAQAAPEPWRDYQPQQVIPSQPGAFPPANLTIPDKIRAKAEDAGYDWRSALRLGATPEQIDKYVTAHPNYKLEQQGEKEQAARSTLGNLIEGGAHAVRSMGRSLAQDAMGPLQKVLPAGVPNNAELAQRQVEDNARSAATTSKGAGWAGD